MVIDEDGLVFFNSLSGRLEITLTESPAPITDKLYNVAAPPSATITSIELRLAVFEEDSDNLRPLIDDEWTRIAFREPVIHLRGAGDRVIEHQAPNGQWFTTRDLAAAIEETERQTRAGRYWFGGIDVHHVLFQGLELDDDGAWSVSWGS